MAVAVAAATAHLGDMPVYLDGLGSVTPLYTVAVHTRIDGQLMAIHYREGQYVHENDVLAEIDPRPNCRTSLRNDARCLGIHRELSQVVLSRREGR